MTWLRGGKRLRETRLWGLTLGIIYHPPAVLAERGYKLVFYTTGDVKLGELGSDIKVGHVSEVNFELQDFGCGAFSFTIDDEPGFEIDYRTRVDIHPYFDIVPWFTGFIQKRPKPGSKRPFVYSGFGFFDQLGWITVTKSYASQDISDIVKDIISTIVAPNSQIIYNAAKVETTGYTMTSINFDHVFARDAIQTLADTAQNFEFGVDNEREFYFRAVTTDVVKSLWAGKHVQEIDVDENPLDIRNKLYVKVGQIQVGGSNIVGEVHDDDSITANGLREDIVTAPEILDGDDALQWAEYILNQKKDPTQSAKITGIFLDTDRVKIDSRGKARFTTDDGSEYTLIIKRVNYKISSQGILADIELGTLAIPFEQHIVNLLRRIQEEQRLGDQRTAQLAP